MPFVNVYAKNVVRGLKRPFVGTKKNVNLSEDDIRICKMYGATVEYVDAEKTEVQETEEKIVETTDAEETVSDNEDGVVETTVSDTETTDAEETVSDNEDGVVETTVSDTENADAEDKKEEEVAEAPKKTQAKNSTKKKNN